MDLTPLIEEPTRDLVDFVTEAIDRFRDDVRGKLLRQLGRH